MELNTGRYAIEQRDFVLSCVPEPVSPVTITVPHDTLGHHELAGLVPERTVGAKQLDPYVWPIVRDIALRTPVQLVRGLLPRSVCDYNRAPEAAFEMHEIRKYWSWYHENIQSCLLRAGLRGQRTLLLDMHGFTKPAPYGEFDVILGTVNRATVTSDVDVRLGEHLERDGYNVFLPREDRIKGKEADYLAGAYTVQANAKMYAADAVQIEIHQRFRRIGAEKQGQALAASLASFIEVEFARRHRER